jgi:1-aminocyclopropane-1-carboxylate deaminase/D-cysteine desulfhydrase-like pyridoxal-dependent ACC family enzyme
MRGKVAAALQPRSRLAQFGQPFQEHTIVTLSHELNELAATPFVSLMAGPTPVDEMPRLRAAIGGGPRLLVKRDDAIPFAFGGNKVRKLEYVAAEAVAAGADILITVGGVQSNHARVTAAVAARLGVRCLLITNGSPPARPTANALINGLLGAEIEYIPSRDERAAAVVAAVERLQQEGRRPYFIPLGASTPLGALGFARAVGELVAQVDEAPDVIVHAGSSGGTQAGLVAGTILHGLPTRVIGISGDDPASAIASKVGQVVMGVGQLLGSPGDAFASASPIEVDAGFVGDGYGIPTEQSREAQQLAARTEALFVDHTYSAKALAALIAYVRAGRFGDDETVLFWHTGGQVGLFA